MAHNYFKMTLLTVATSAVLTACGGSGGSGDGNARELIELNSAHVSLQPLKSSASSFATHLKNGIYTSSISQYCSDCVNMPTTDEAVQNSPAPTTDFSQTNTQESGVDEADRIKYDGNYLYMAANKYNDPIIDADNDVNDKDYIKVMERHSSGEMSDTARVELPESFNSVKSLYLRDDALVAVGNHYYWHDPMFAVMDIWHPFDQTVNFAIYDVSNPADVSLQTDVNFDGHLVSSRRIEDNLYFVSTYSPTIDNLNYGASSDADKQQNYDKVMATSVASLMPQITINGVTSNLVEAENCYIPEDATNVDGYDSIVTITRVNLTAPDQLQSVCINALTHDIYVSTESMYLMGVDSNQQAVLHRFALNDAIDYVGTGNVEGHFGWRNASFRLSEHDDHLRVVTTKLESEQLVHQLFVLSNQGQNNTLPVVAKLPNEQQPQQIGKPGEDIFAVRYFNDIGYIVTFERIDPLYVLDLSDPNQPSITGELEVPGFSTYLHPINEDLLLGVGQDVAVVALPENGQPPVTTMPPAPNGTKVALFDVSDKTNPQLVESLFYPNGFTPVEWDHHAFSFLPVGDNQVKITFPISDWLTNDEGYWTPSDRLKLLEVNFDGNGAELIEHSELVAPQTVDSHYYIDSSQDRGIIHGDDVYYVHGNEVIKGSW